MIRIAPGDTRNPAHLFQARRLLRAATMKTLVITVVLGMIGCGESSPPPSLEGTYACGPHTCTTGQVCSTQSSGSQCQVNDAGIGQYQEYAWDCIDLPSACDGVLSCDCVTGGGICYVADDGRTVDFGCV